VPFVVAMKHLDYADSYHAPEGFLKKVLEKISRVSTEAIIPPTKETEKEKKRKILTKHRIIMKLIQFIFLYPLNCLPD
jgi:hypothetical protein